MSSISVIVPIYNASKYLQECISSILQEMKECDELILIDDGSQDDSYEICRQNQRHNVRVIRNENHGVSYTRNCGIAQATKDYLLFVDADDYLINGWRDILNQVITSEKDVIFFANDDVLHPTKEEIIKNILFLPTENKLNISPGACWYKLFRREYIVAENIKFNHGLINGEDGIFVLESVLKTESYVIEKAINFYYYRPNDNSATHRFNIKYNDSNMLYIELVEKMLMQHGIFDISKVHEYIDFIHARGLYILASKISLIEDPVERRKQYYLFEQDVYVRMYHEYTPNTCLSKMVRDTFRLLRKRKYDSAIRMITLRRAAYRLLKKTNIIRR